MLYYIMTAFKLLKRVFQVGPETNDEISSSRRNILLFNASTNLSMNLISGNFFTGFLLLLNADDGFIGLVAMAGSFGNLLQLLSPIIMERFPSRKRLLILVRAVFYFFNIIIIGLVPFFPFKNGTKLMIILTVVLFVNFFNALASPGFAVWHIHINNVPEKMRAEFFSRITIINGVLIFTVILLASKLTDVFKENGKEMQGLLLFRGVALIFCLLDIYLLFNIKEHPNEPSDTQINLINIFINPFKEKKYLISVAAACLWIFSSNIPGPYYGVYLLKDLKVSYSFINIVNMANIPALILLTPLWRRLIDSTSWFKTLYTAIFLYSLSYLGLAVTTGETLYFYVISSFFNIMIMPGISVVISNVQYINIPARNQTNYIGFFSTMTSLSALLGLFTGKEFLKFTDGIHISLFGISMQNKQYILLVSAASMLISAVLIYFMQKRLAPGNQQQQKNLPGLLQRRL